MLNLHLKLKLCQYFININKNYKNVLTHLYEEKHIRF